LENNAVRSIEVKPDGVLISSDKGVYEAKVLVGADGSNGSARRFMRRFEKETHTARVLETINPGNEQDPKFAQQYAWFDFSPIRQNLQGYFWDFPSRINGNPVYNRGVYDARILQGRPKADLTQLIHASLDNLGSDPSSNHVEGHPIHWFTPHNLFAIPHLLLAGDAAGAEPLFGEGIGPALAAGRVAADAIGVAFKRQDFSFQDYRRSFLRSNVGKYLLLRWRTAYWSYRFCRKPGFMRMLWSVGPFLTRIWKAQDILY
jgi:menaquinone-9 beta-reductase